jgi:hypothetical protein
MSLRERLGLAAVPPRVVTPFPAALEQASYFGKPPVQPSEDLNRIAALPRRNLETAWTTADFEALEARLKLPAREVKCVCRSFSPPRDCPEHLLVDQARALLEAEKHNGLFSAMGVGKGKTLVDMLLPWVMNSKIAVLLLPAALVSKFLEVDWKFYGGHWRLPDVVSQTKTQAVGGMFHLGYPKLHVLSYEKLSRQEGADLLMRIKPDLVIDDEAHKLKSRKSGRTLRVERCVNALKPRKAVQSGTMASRGIADAAHLAFWALGQNSPFPIKPNVVEEWGTALDPIVNDDEPAAPLGALERLCDPGEHVRDAFRRRRNDTPGVVATVSSSFEGSLLIRKRVPKIPAAILPLIAQAHKGNRPDGEESKEQLMGAQWARQLACGFFHRWRFPRGEPAELIKRWKDARRDWHRAIRKKLEHPREHLDTPGLVENAAKRWFAGYDGDLPTWAAPDYPAWAEIEDQVQPVTSTVWLDRGCPEVDPIPGADFLVNDAVEWALDVSEGPGIVWCEFPELGERIAKAAGIPWYGGGPEASRLIILEKGDRPIVASMHAHRDGKDLQYAFARNYFTSPFADGGSWEQAIGRTHRQGQRADEVIVDIAQHTEDFESAFAKARERARFIQMTDGQPQKLLFADYEW